MVHPRKTRERDVDVVIAMVRQRLPQVRTQQLRVKHPADDDGLWFFTLPGVHLEVQIESSTGQCPFLIENDANADRVTSNRAEETASAVVRLLEPGNAGHD